jgi:hypothetical protein
MSYLRIFLKNDKHSDFLLPSQMKRNQENS